MPPRPTNKNRVGAGAAGINDEILEAAKGRTGRARRAAWDAVGRLLLDGMPVDFQTVSREAGCSAKFLYSQPDIKERIEAIREEQRQAGQARTPEFEPGVLKERESQWRMALLSTMLRYEQAAKGAYSAPQTPPLSEIDLRASLPAIRNAISLLKQNAIPLSLWRVHYLTGLEPAEIHAAINADPTLINYTSTDDRNALRFQRAYDPERI